MKRILFLLLLVMGNRSFAGTPLIQFKISKPLCVLTFLHTAAGDAHTSSTLYSYIWKNAHGQDSLQLMRTVDQFRNLPIDFSYNIPGYPDSRPQPRNTVDLITIAAVQARDEAEFMQRIIGLVPNETWLQLKQVMADAAPLYDKILGVPYREDMNKQLAALQKYNARLDNIFNKLKRFYGSTWSTEIPFTVGIYAVPGKVGNTNATPHSNSLVLATLTEEKDHDMRVSIAVHEICHVLYGEQPMAMQQRMDSWFATSKDPNATFAMAYIDEALATACGNAWAYKMLAGKEDTGELYSNEYINTYAHAIYPLVQEYIHADRVLDSAFVQRAIALFSSSFPVAYKSYENLMNKVNIYTDASGGPEFGNINNIVGRYFKISLSYGSYPIAESMQQLDEATGTQFFVVYKDHADNYKLLTARFPELRAYAASAEGVISFFDKKKRPVIIINAKDDSRLYKALEQMRRAKEIKADQMFLPLE